MHKKHSTTHLNLYLSDVIIVALESKRSISKAMSEINFDTCSDSDKIRLQALTNVTMIINDILHPVYEIAKTLLPGAVKLIEMCEEQQAVAIKQGYVAPCKDCYDCKRKLVV
jgi:hypothetical protein